VARGCCSCSLAGWPHPSCCSSTQPAEPLHLLAAPSARQPPARGGKWEPKQSASPWLSKDGPGGGRSQANLIDFCRVSKYPLSGFFIGHSQHSLSFLPFHVALFNNVQRSNFDITVKHIMHDCTARHSCLSNKQRIPIAVVNDMGRAHNDGDSYHTTTA